MLRKCFLIILLLIVSTTYAASLQVDTATTIIVGPMVDYADGKTLLKDVNNFDTNDIKCYIYKNSTGSEKTLAGNFVLTGDGMGSLTLSATDVNTPGTLKVCFDNNEPSGISTETILPFSEHYTVYPANIYASFFGSDKLQVDVVQAEGSDYTDYIESRTLPTANYFDPAVDIVAHVTLVDTTTTNTDMRGTDNAALATALTTAQNDLDVITGSDGVLLSTQAKADINAEADTAISDAVAAGSILSLIDLTTLLESYYLNIAFDSNGRVDIGKVLGSAEAAKRLEKRR